MCPSFRRSNKGIFQDNSNVLSIFHGTDAFLLEDELNESQWNHIEARAEMFRAQYTSGILSDFNLVKVDNNSSYIETKDSKPFYVLVDGYLVKIGGNQFGNILSSDSRLIFDTNLENEVDKLHFIEFWFEAINHSQDLRKFGGEDTSLITNKMLDDRIKTETSRRIQMQWKISYHQTLTLDDEIGKWIKVGDHLYKKNFNPIYDLNGNLTNPGIRYAIIVAKNSHVSGEELLIHEEARVKLKENNAFKDLNKGENGDISFTDENNLFESETLNGALDELKIQSNNIGKNRTEIVTDIIHSGFTKLGEIGEDVILDDNYLIERNNFELSESTVYINGQRISIPKRMINLSEPPENGSREDLVFLEAFWTMKNPGDAIYKNNCVEDSIERYTITYEKILEWRIRIVDGVDFAKFTMDGFTVDTDNLDSDKYNNKVILPMGKKSSPITYNTSQYDNGIIRFSNYKQNSNNDIGFYLAGNGDAESKLILDTIDGYIYAIPMFKIKRRNSKEFSANNSYGSSSVKQVIKQYIDFNNVQPNELQKLSLNSDLVQYFKTVIGRKFIYVPEKESYKFLVVSADETNNVVTIKNIGTQLIDYNDAYWVIVSSRPDEKYSDVVYRDDIIDLRHKVSFSNCDYKSLLEKNFNKLLKGKLNTKEQIKMKKEYINLQPAQIEIASSFKPVKVNQADGNSKKLVNMMSGFSNNSKSKMYWLTPPEYYGDNPLEFKWIEEENAFSATKEYFCYTHSVPVNVKINSYYLAGFKLKGGTGYFHIHETGNENSFTDITGIAENDEYQNFYLPFKTENKRSIYYEFENEKLNSGGTRIGYYETMFKDVFLYEIDEATYNLILNKNVEYVGDKLTQKFPYVSSYPTVVENLIPNLNSEIWDQYSKAKIVNGKLVLTANESEVNSFIVLDGQSFTTYILECDYISEDGKQPTIYTTSDKVDWWELGFVYRHGSIIVFYTGNWTSKIAIDFHNSNKGTFTFENFKLSKVNSYIEQYVPYGRWVLPEDLILENLNLKTNLRDDRKTISDAITLDTVVDKIEAAKTSQKHIITKQATKGIWSIGDTITIKAEKGIIGGVLNSEDILAKILTNSGGSISKVEVDDISKLTVNKSFKIFNASTNEISNTVYNVNDILVGNKQIVFSPELTIDDNDVRILVETSVSNSVPLAKAAGLIGTWEGLESKKVIFKITTPPTTNNSDIELRYVVNYQAGEGIKKVPCEIFNPIINDIEYTRDSSLELKADFRGKVIRSVIENPHVVKESITSTTLLNPLDSGWIEYDGSMIQYLNGLVRTLESNSSDKITQQIFSFDILEEVERQIGRIPKITKDEKLQWLKNNISGITSNWYGYGSSVGGYGVEFAVFAASIGWTNKVNHLKSNISKLSITSFDLQNLIDSNGLMYFTVYTINKSNTSTPSIVFTDYIELNILMKNVSETDYETFTPSIKERLLVDDPSLFKEGENMINPINILPYTSLDKSTNTVMVGLPSSYNNTNIVSDYDFTVNIKDLINNKGFSVRFMSQPNKYYTLSFDLKLIKSANGIRVGILKDNGQYSYTTYTTDGLISTTINVPKTGEVVFVVESLTNQGSFKASNLMLTPGLTSKPFVPFSKFVKRKRKLNFLNKISGSTFENPHRDLWKDGNLEQPSEFFEENEQIYYEQASKEDGTVMEYYLNTIGRYPQDLFEFDLSHLGLSLSEIRAALKKVKVRWVGFGFGDSGGKRTYGSTIYIWENNAWNNSYGLQHNSNTSAVIEKDIPFNTNKSIISDDQKIRLLSRSTYPASKNIQASTFVDYVSLEIELADWVDTVKKNVVKVRKETKEIKTIYPTVSPSTGRTDKIELFYNYVPYQGILINSINSLRTKYADNNFMYNTTLGTGNICKSGSNVESVNLPLTPNTRDFDLVPKKQSHSYNNLESKNVRFNLNNSNIGLPNYYSLVDLDFNLENSDIKIERGIYAYSSTPYGFLTIDTLDNFSLLYHPMLVEFNNQLYMIVFAYNNNHNNTLSAVDMFSIDGRPLLKEDS
ncbi:gp420 [Bacillus phage G]|uniref:Gp420 n=1 Tax=Bacillus phage G TaxID=2884420 RepID=G3MAG1_9CAUD|nr:gp420 [Bacillus phage G]AEO93678.1 gp420 [Bacillus phage G]